MGYIYASLWRVVNQKCPFSLAHETVLWCPPTKFVAQQINNALMHKTPHSGHIPASSLGSFRGTESRHGGLQPPSIRPGNSGSCPSLTDRRPTGIVPALDSSGLSTALGFVAAKPPSIRGAWGRRAWTKHGRAAQFDHDRPTP